MIPYNVKGVTYWKPAPEPKQPVLKLRGYLGESIAERRKEKNITLRDVGTVSISHLSDIERGKKEASSEVLESLCASLGIKLSELLRSTADKLEEVGK